MSNAELRALRVMDLVEDHAHEMPPEVVAEVLKLCIRHAEMDVYVREEAATLERRREELERREKKFWQDHAALVRRVSNQRQEIKRLTRKLSESHP